MPRSKGLRDDDILGRLAEIETRLDALDGGGEDAPTGRTTDAARVPERDERRDTEPRNRQVMVQVEGRDADQVPGMPDHMAGGHEEDNVRVMMAADRERAERRASREDDDDDADGKGDPKADRADEVKDAMSPGQRRAAADPRQVAPPSAKPAERPSVSEARRQSGELPEASKPMVGTTREAAADTDKVPNRTSGARNDDQAPGRSEADTDKPKDAKK
jgi:hypothetical protein